MGFPIAAALIGFYLVQLTLEFILQGVSTSINGLIDITRRLNDRVKIMSNEVLRLDILISSVLNVRPDLERVARAERADQRKD